MGNNDDYMERAKFFFFFFFGYFVQLEVLCNESTEP